MIHIHTCSALRACASTFFCTIGTACTAFVLPVLLAGTPGAYAQAFYPTPDAAASAFVNALATGNQDGMKHVLGHDYGRLIPTQDIGEDDIYDFLGAWAQGHEIVTQPGRGKGGQTAHLAVGTNGWTLPVPLVQTSRGWYFDTAAGKDELDTRRIGRNERAAMMTSLAYLDAQNEYRNLTGHYARRLVSTPGQRDGLYWPLVPGEADSPLGPLAAAMPEGATLSRDGYRGYHYRILTTQGTNAKGGPQDYASGGVMTKGCALVAWPAQYGTTGVMSFIVNQDGQLYQQNLGPQTARIASAIRSFDPGPSWSPVQP